MNDRPKTWENNGRFGNTQEFCIMQQPVVKDRLGIESLPCHLLVREPRPFCWSPERHYLFVERHQLPYRRWWAPKITHAAHLVETPAPSRVSAKISLPLIFLHGNSYLLQLTNALSNRTDTEISEWKMKESHILALSITLKGFKSVLVTFSKINNFLFPVYPPSAFRVFGCLHRFPTDFLFSFGSHVCQLRLRLNQI